jgi:hypothetical protein
MVMKELNALSMVATLLLVKVGTPMRGKKEMILRLTQRSACSMAAESGYPAGKAKGRFSRLLYRFYRPPNQPEKSL